MKKPTKNLKRFLLLSCAMSCLVILAGVFWMVRLNERIEDGLARKIFLPPTEYYAAPIHFSAQETWDYAEIRSLFTNRQYRERDWEEKLFPGDFSESDFEKCQNTLPLPLPEGSRRCLLFTAKASADPELNELPLQLLAFSQDGKILGTYQGNPLQPAPQVSLEPELIAQYLDRQPISQNYHPLGNIPTQCLNGVLAIEDAKFLEHSGFSYSGFARAIYSNIFHRGGRQGGSTITQQLVKNYFLTAEKTLQRKITELAMAILLEAHSSKDEILETYLNVIYLGQNGPFQIRGFGAAAQYYFNKPLETLELHECALLAAVLNSPGLFDPYRKPENAMKRRGLVLDRMLELGMINASDASTAKTQALPSERRVQVTETAPYYIDAVNREIEKMGLSLLGLKVFTGLSLVDQKAAQEAIRNQLNELESKNPKVKALKEKSIPLEGALLSAENRTGLITSIVGGRSYQLTQFNRAIEAHRQVGSIMKPFVYLTALLGRGENGIAYDPTTVLNDSKFSYQYEGQSWSPDNYGKKYFGQVPMYFALKNSLNAATASLGIAIGLAPIINTAKDLGITSELQKVPSLTLGAFEIYPYEVLTAYVSVARFGNRTSLSTLRGIADEQGRKIYVYEPKSSQAVEPMATASLVSMMKQTVLSGTARLISLSHFPIPAAGKTGTTSDYKDAWFGGFTPARTTIVWVGNDNPTTNGLTGASGAVPIWLQFMKKASEKDSTLDFQWPQGTEVRTISKEEISEENEKLESLKFDLVFKVHPNQ